MNRGGAGSEGKLPKVVVSHCLLGGNCRWDGDVIHDEAVAGLRERAELIPVCPELAIGLGLPRDRIVIETVAGEARLVQPSTGRDLTTAMLAFADRFLASLPRVDGFILKHKSPSCGLRDVKRYTAGNYETYIDRCAVGLFACAVTERFPALPVIDEEQLADQASRAEFLARIEQAAVRSKVS